MADTVVVTAPDAAAAVLSPTLTDAIGAAQLSATQAMGAASTAMAVETIVNNAESVALEAASSAAASAAAAAASAVAGGISTTVAMLPTGTPGLLAWATNGLNIGETTGTGTGVEVRYSSGAWRNTYNGAPVSS